MKSTVSFPPDAGSSIPATEAETVEIPTYVMPELPGGAWNLTRLTGVGVVVTWTRVPAELTVLVPAVTEAKLTSHGI